MNAPENSACIVAGEQYEDHTFSEISLEKKKLKSTGFYRCTFERVNFQFADLSVCVFEDCRFKYCNASMMNPAGSRFSGTTFDNCKLMGVNWSHTNKLFSAFYKNCIMDNAVFSGMSLKKSTFEGNSLTDAMFIDTNLAGVSFSNCDLQDCRFERTDLAGTNFTTACNYFIDSRNNYLCKTKFSMPEAISLLRNFDIIVE